MKVVRVSLVSLLVACGSREEPPQPMPAPTPEAAAAPRPAPGLDLAGPIPLPSPTEQPRSAPRTIDLMSDRALVKVSVPTPPHGGAVQFTFADDRRAWVTHIPDSQQLPSVAYAKERIFISGGFDSVSFYSLDAKTGKVDWATTNLEDNGPTAAVIEGDDVLFNTESCTLFSLDVATGRRNWFRYIGDPTLAQIAVTDGLIYAAHPGEIYEHHGDYSLQKLTAFKVKTGTPVWSRPISGELLATPVIAGDSVYVSTIGGDTYRFDHRNGKLRWKKRLHATTAPWIADNELYVARRVKGKEQQVVVSTENGKILREHAVSTGAYTHDVPTDLGNWKAVWAFEGSRPVIERGIRYVAMGNEVHASDAQTGDPLWTRRYPVDADKRSLGSIALASSAVVVSSRDGKVFGLDVDTGFTLWSYDLGRSVAAEPIIAKGWLYATTTDGYVIALEVADPSLDGWHMFGGNAQKNGPVLTPVTPPSSEGGPSGTSAMTTTAAADANVQSRADLDRDTERAKRAAEANASAAEHAAAERARQEAERAIERERARTKAAVERAQEAARAKAMKLERSKPFIISEACKNNPLC